MEYAPDSQARDLFSGCGDVLIEMGAIVIERTLQSLRERRRGTPFKRRGDLRRVGIKVADVDRLFLRRPWRAAESPRTRDPNHEFDEIAVSDRLETAHVEDFAIG